MMCAFRTVAAGRLGLSATGRAAVQSPEEIIVRLLVCRGGTERGVEEVVRVPEGRVRWMRVNWENVLQLCASVVGLERYFQRAGLQCKISRRRGYQSLSSHDSYA